MPEQQTREILGIARTVKELLSGTKYSIDFYQREYKWQQKQIVELINDLTNRFLDDFDEAHSRSEVSKYGHYFLGSIVISHKDGQSFLIDGQQRLTSLTLLLMYLNNLQKDRSDKVNITQLIYSEKYGVKSFNINVEERIACMNALFEGKESYEPPEESDSVANMMERYDDIGEAFPSELQEKALPYFIDWLIDNVHLVAISAYSDEDAYMIFETMNDRGLSLTPTEMLKGYLLSKITDSTKRNQCNDLWKKLTNKLTDLGKDEDADCIKAWLRSQYAETIRDRKKDATPGDFDRIGSEFHRWVRDKEDLLGLNHTDKFVTFIKQDYEFFAKQYLQLRNLARKYTDGREHVFYNAQIGFTQQYQVLLAPLCVGDSETDINTKIKMTAIYLDIMLARRMWNFRSNDYSTLQYSIFQLSKAIRRKTITELAEILMQRLAEEKETFVQSREKYHLHGNNRKHIKNMLARMTVFVEEKSGLPNGYITYVTSRGKKNFEVEHLWADHPERHTDDFKQPAEFSVFRNYIGGLVLLPKNINQSYNDLPYAQKVQYYAGENILAKSLHENTYKHNPGFTRFIAAAQLPFKPYAEFKKVDLMERQDLYQKLAEMVWNAEQIKEAAGLNNVAAA